MLPRRLIPSLLVAAVLMAVIQLGVVTIAFDKLGLSPDQAILILGLTLLGSVINVPLFSLRNDLPAATLKQRLVRWQRADMLGPGRTLIAVNLGGCVVPLCASGYLFFLHPVAPLHALVVVALVAVIAYQGSMLMPGVGMVMPALFAPFAAAFIGVNLDPNHGAVLAYIGGTLGVLIGVDLLHLKDIGHLGEPLALIGGAGTFDGIFITGILAALLA